jgi:hypothetical protein
MRVTSPEKKKRDERESCDLCSALHNTDAVSRTCSTKTPPSSTMINVFPAESTRSASIWSSRVSTPSTGVTTVRIAGIVTVMYIAVAKTNAAIYDQKDLSPRRERSFRYSFSPVREERVCPRISLRGRVCHLPNDPPSKNIALSSQRCILVMIAITPTAMRP